MATEMELMSRDIRKMTEVLEKSLHSPVPGAGAAHMFGGRPEQAFNFPTDWKDERVIRLVKSMPAYDSSMVNMMCQGRQRITGIGPSLAKFAALKSRQDEAIQICKNQGLLQNGYSLDHLTKEHGIAPYGMRVTKAANGRDWEVTKGSALAETAGSTGGYTIPPQFLSNLLTIAAEDGFIKQKATVIPMTTLTAQWPMLDITTVQATGTSPYFGGILAQWQPEAASISQTQPAFKQSTWTAWNLVLYTVSSNQLLQDNGIGLDALLNTLFAQANTWYQEYAFLRGLGSGSSMPLGILNAPATYGQSRTTTNRFQFADAAAMMSRLQIRSWDTACWIIHQSVIPQLLQMVGGGYTGSSASSSNPTGNMLSWLNQMPSGDVGPLAMKLPNAFLGGLPLYITEKLPQLGTTGDVCLVDWSRYVIGNRMDIQIDVSPHYLFQNNQLAWRVISRCDGKPWLNSSITDAEGWTISPMVMLNH